MKNKFTTKSVLLFFFKRIYFQMTNLPLVKTMVSQTVLLNHNKNDPQSRVHKRSSIGVTQTVLNRGYIYGLQSRLHKRPSIEATQTYLMTHIEYLHSYIKTFQIVNYYIILFDVNIFSLLIIRCIYINIHRTLSKKILQYFVMK